MSIPSWTERGRRADVGGNEVFYIDVGDGESIVFLHGYPSSSYDLHLVIDQLAGRHRVVAHDHVGFGMSSKPRDFPYTLRAQATVATELYAQLGLDRVHLVAHDYGQTVAAELLARRAEGELELDIATVTLCNGSTLIELAEMSRLQRLVPTPILGRLLVNLSNRWIFRRQLRRVLGRNDAVPDGELDDMWHLMTRDGGRRVWPKIARYQAERRASSDRFVGALETLDVPSHIVWGRLDAVAVPRMAEVLAEKVSGARLTWLDDLGHYPMLEGPHAWASAVLDFIDDLMSPP